MNLRTVVTILVLATLLVAVLGACKKSDEEGAAPGATGGPAGMGPKAAGGPAMPGAPGAAPGGPAMPGAPGAAPGGPAMPGAPGAAPGGPAMPGAAGAKGPGMGGPGMGSPGMGGPGMGGAPGVPGAPGAPGAAPAGADASKLAAEALALKHKGDYEKAAAKYEEAIAADTRNVDAHWGLAWTMAAMGRDKNDAVKLTRAKEEFQRFLQLSKDSGKTAEAKAALGRLGGG